MHGIFVLYNHYQGENVTAFFFLNSRFRARARSIWSALAACARTRRTKSIINKDEARAGGGKTETCSSHIGAILKFGAYDGCLHRYFKECTYACLAVA